MKNPPYFFLIAIISFFNCSSNTNPIDEIPLPTEFYFPPINSSTWKTLTVSKLEWNEAALQPLFKLYSACNSGVPELFNVHQLSRCFGCEITSNISSEGTLIRRL